MARSRRSNAHKNTTGEYETMEPATAPATPRRPTFWDYCTRITEFLVTFLGLAAIIGIIYLAAGQLRGHDPQGALALEQYDATTLVACKSMSMGLVVRCNDTLLLRTVTPEQSLRPGHLYIYRAGNGTIVHRYVIAANTTIIIMKGDNNRAAEAVNRTDIKYEVVGTYYDRG